MKLLTAVLFLVVVCCALAGPLDAPPVRQYDYVLRRPVLRIETPVRLGGGTNSIITGIQNYPATNALTVFASGDPIGVSLSNSVFVGAPSSEVTILGGALGESFTASAKSYLPVTYLTRGISNYQAIPWLTNFQAVAGAGVSSLSSGQDRIWWLGMPATGVVPYQQPSGTFAINSMATVWQGNTHVTNIWLEAWKAKTDNTLFFVRRSTISGFPTSGNNALVTNQISPPLWVNPGDYIGVHVQADTSTATWYASFGDGHLNLSCSADVAGVTTNITATLVSSNKTPMVNFFATNLPPMIALVGDSHMAGGAGSATNDSNPSWNYEISFGVPCLGFSRGSTSLATNGDVSITQNLFSLATNTGVKLFVLEGGSYDINYGTVGSFTNSCAYMFQQISNLGGYCAFQSIYPTTTYTNTLMATRDVFNAALSNMIVQSYSDRVLWMNTDDIIGTNRPGGTPTPPANNKWDDIPAWVNTDNQHLRSAGYAALAPWTATNMVNWLRNKGIVLKY